MKRATVSHLKNNLSAYLRRVRAGDPVVIYDRDIPIARLERIESTRRGSDRLTLLSDQGVTRPPSRPLAGPQLRKLLANALDSSSRVLGGLIQDRAEDR
ncbi:MAG TPA: type II toxin-antitoxin system prevent-host-death family antitoxin [Steroidobacteraceae bacterium]|nr:type II toxin-antitoxin system prevent-host-death family antitoxin [Steroidobacteraceae bacterium]